MDGYLQTALGILVSIVLFLLGYRQTVGAKKERVRLANASVHKALLKRIVLENYSPTFQDISRVLEGKAREFRVPQNNLMSEEQMLNSLFTEVFDNDLIAPPQRVEIESKLNSVFKEIESTDRDEMVSFEQQTEVEKDKTRLYPTAIMAISASIMGAMISILPDTIKSNSSNSEWIFSGVGVLLLSLTVTSLIALLKKTKDSQEQPSQKSQQRLSSSFEFDIAKLLDRQGVKYQIAPYNKTEPRYRPDFLITIQGEDIVIEAKAWQSAPPLNFIKRTVFQLKNYIEKTNATKAILVTKENIPVSKGALREENIDVLSFSEFSKFVKRNK
jgi:hypothetical protein